MKSFLADVADDIVKKFGSDLKDITIVFNNKRPSLFLLQHLAAKLGKPFFSPSVQTIDEFFAAASPYVVADNFTQSFALLQSYNEVLTQEGESSISAEAFFNTAQSILSDFAQVDRDMVDALRLFRQMQNIAEIETQFDGLDEEQRRFLTQFWQTFSPDKKQQQQEMFLRLWNRMPALYQRFHERLLSQGLTTSAKNYREVAAGSYALPEFANKILFVGFNALSVAEEKVFVKLQDKGKALFYFDTDVYYLDDPMQEAGYFVRKNANAGLINQLEPKNSWFADKEKTIHVHSVEGDVAQVKLLNEHLKEYYPLVQERDNPNRVAIVLANENLLLPLLQTIPLKYPPDLGYEVPLNITMGYPFTASPLFSLTETWMNFQHQLQKNKLHFQDVERFLNHPYLTIDSDAVNAFWKDVLQKQRTEISVSEVQALAPQHFFFFKQANGAIELIQIFQRAMQQVVAELRAKKLLKKIDAEFFVALLAAVNNFENSLVTNEVKINSQFALSLLKKALSSVTVPFTGEPLKGLQIMGLLETRNLDFDHLFLVGANEGLIPKKNSGISFIPDSIRRAYKLPVLENQNAISAYLFYRLIQRAKTVHIMFNNIVSDTSSGEPSRFLRQLQFESNLNFHHHIMAQPVRVVNLRERTIEKTRPVMQKLESFFDRSGEYDKKISASAFATYLECTMKFFLQYVARIKEPENVAEVAEANVIGSVLHQLMDDFYRPYLKHTVTAKDIEERKQSLTELTKNAFANIVLKSAKIPEPIEGYRQVVLAIIEQYAALIIEHDLKIAPFTLHELENKSDYIYAQPINLNGRERKVRLFGIIDRVDEKNGELRIVDYKTGKDELKYISVPDLFDRENGKGNKALLQTLFYSYVYEKIKKQNIRPELYAVTKMTKDGTRFFTGEKIRVLMEGDVLSREKTLFEEYLIKTLQEIFDPEIPFQNTTDTSVCKYCIYGKICGRNLKTSS